MSLRARLVAAVALVLAIALGASFATLALVVGRTERAQLDEALRDEATREARIVAAGPRDTLPPEGAAPSADDTAPRRRYVAVYDRDGVARVTSPAFGPAPPSLARLRETRSMPFDLPLGTGRLRCVLVPVRDPAGSWLLLGASRADLDADARLLTRMCLMAFALALAFAVMAVRWTIGRSTRDLDRIAASAMRVAAGDLASRTGVAPERRDEIARLARDVDAMVDRLASLVHVQQRFVADAAHELRSPLTALYGELTLALHHERDAAGYRRAIEDGVEATEQLVRLAEDLLALARLRGLRERQDEPVDLLHVARRAVDGLDEAARSAGVTVDVRGDRAMAPGRAADLERMVRNLVENAIRHAPAHSRVDVATGVTARDAVVTVVDAGCGVDDALRERVFEPFYRGARERADARAGAGLGLAIARQIARDHGGDVVVRARGDGARGACFEASLSRRRTGA